MRKKLLIGILTGAILLSGVGCSNGTKEDSMKNTTKKVVNQDSGVLDLDKIKKELEQLKIKGMYVPGVYAAVKDEEYFDGILEGVDDFSEFGFTEKDIMESAIKTSKNKKHLYAVIRPVDGREDLIKNGMTKYFRENDIKDETFDEKEGVLIYVASKANSKLINTIKDTKQKVFGMMMEVQNSQIEEIFQIDKSMIAEFLMKIPGMTTDSNTYIIVKPAENKKEQVKTAIDNYVEGLQVEWKKKEESSDQYELVKNRIVTEVGDYLIYIISRDNQSVLKVITNNSAY